MNVCLRTNVCLLVWFVSQRTGDQIGPIIKPAGTFIYFSSHCSVGISASTGLDCKHKDNRKQYTYHFQLKGTISTQTLLSPTTVECGECRVVQRANPLPQFIVTSWLFLVVSGSSLLGVSIQESTQCSDSTRRQQFKKYPNPLNPREALH